MGARRSRLQQSRHSNALVSFSHPLNSCCSDILLVPISPPGFPNHQTATSIFFWCHLPIVCQLLDPTNKIPSPSICAAPCASPSRRYPQFPQFRLVAIQTHHTSQARLPTVARAERPHEWTSSSPVESLLARRGTRRTIPSTATHEYRAAPQSQTLKTRRKKTHLPGRQACAV